MSTVDNSTRTSTHELERRSHERTLPESPPWVASGAIGMADYARRPPGVPAVIPSVFPGPGLVSADIPRAHTHTSTEIPPSIVHPRKDLFTALDLQPLYACYVKAPVNPSAYPRSFVSDVKSESRRGSNLADGSVPGTPGGKDGSSGGKKPPKPKLFSSVYEELLQEIPGESHLSGSRLIHLRLAFHAARSRATTAQRELVRHPIPSVSESSGRPEFPVLVPRCVG